MKLLLSLIFSILCLQLVHAGDYSLKHMSVRDGDQLTSFKVIEIKPQIKAYTYLQSGDADKDFEDMSRLSREFQQSAKLLDPAKAIPYLSTSSYKYFPTATKLPSSFTDKERAQRKKIYQAELKRVFPKYTPETHYLMLYSTGEAKMEVLEPFICTAKKGDIITVTWDEELKNVCPHMLPVLGAKMIYIHQPINGDRYKLDSGIYYNDAEIALANRLAKTPAYYAISEGPNYNKVTWKQTTRQAFALLKTDNVFESYFLETPWSKEATIHRTLVSPSGDWFCQLQYNYTKEGKLKSITSQFSTHGAMNLEKPEQDTVPARCYQNFTVDKEGKITESFKQITNLKTNKAENKLQFYQPEIKHWMKLKDLPQPPAPAE